MPTFAFRTHFVLSMLCFSRFFFRFPVFSGFIVIKTLRNKHGLSLQPCENNKMNGGLRLLHSTVHVQLHLDWKGGLIECFVTLLIS